MGTYGRILLTGGTGFVGPYLLDALARAYPEAERTVVLRSGETTANPAWSPAVADILDEAALHRILAEHRPDLVVHLAAQASVAQSLDAAEGTWRVNFHGSFNLATAIARHAPQAVVLFASTGDVYGLRLRDGIATEHAAPWPLNAYARSKIAAEGMFSDVLPQSCRLIVARPFNHIGPGQDLRFALPSFAAQIAGIESGRLAPRVEVGDLSVERDFLDVRDVTEAYVRLVESAARLPPRSVFNIASGRPRSLASLLDGLRALSKKDFEIIVDATRLRPSEVPVAIGDASKLREFTGWRPRRSIDETLVDLLEHSRAVEARSLKEDAAR
jgi:GDP-4-dehydro-6-deoxy-D-mannose reductase